MDNPDSNLIFILALAMWREASDQGSEGMQAVGCVIRNNIPEVQRHLTSAWWYRITKPFYLSSMTAPHDIGCARWPAFNDVVFSQALLIAKGIFTGTIQDNTIGATNYLNKKLTIAQQGALPHWTNTMKETTEIGDHTFYA